MRVPEADHAVVDRRKITDYVLNPDHPCGRHKARVFREALGWGPENTDDLIRALLDAVANTDTAQFGLRDLYGDRYVVDSSVTGPRGSAKIRSVWIVTPASKMPRLITCYVL